MKLYEFGPTRSIRVRWVLQELEVPFESHVVNLPQGEQRTPEFLKLNPAGKLPVLVDGDVVLNESVAIALYLGEKYPQKGFVPMDARGRAELYRWLMFVVTELEQPLWRMAKHSFVYPESQRIPAELPNAIADFKAMAPVLETHLKGREFLVGDRVTVGDFVTAYTLDWADEQEILGDFPGLGEYMERMYRRPHAGPRIATEFARIGG
jgi:glutathione S-transferase